MRLFLCLLLVVPVCAGTARAQDAHRHEGHGDHGHPHGAPHVPDRPATGPDAAIPVGALPAPPPGVTHLEFRELFVRPVGPRGLEIAPPVRALAGRPVRILGYMVGTDRPVPGLMLLAPYPMELHESEYDEANDLPPSALHVIVPGRRDGVVPYTPGPLLLTGTLEIGPQAMADGRQSHLRLRLDPPGTGSASPEPDGDHGDHAHRESHEHGHEGREHARHP